MQPRGPGAALSRRRPAALRDALPARRPPPVPSPRRDAPFRRTRARAGENTLKLVCFDVDGTLVDSQAMIVAAQSEAFAACGLPPPSRARMLSIVGLSLPEAFTALVGPQGPVAALAEAYKAAFNRLRADPACAEPLFPGAAATVARLSARPDVRLGIATGKSRRGVAYLLAREGWESTFATIQTADDAPSKPDPGMLLRAMHETGIAADRAMMVGDTTFDMAMARAAGMRAVGVTWGYHPVGALREAGAHEIIDGFDALAVGSGTTRADA